MAPTRIVIPSIARNLLLDFHRSACHQATVMNPEGLKESCKALAEVAGFDGTVGVVADAGTPRIALRPSKLYAPMTCASCKILLAVTGPMGNQPQVRSDVVAFKLIGASAEAESH